MQVIIEGQQNTEEAVESLSSILNLFKERYGIENFRGITVDLGLVNGQGVNVELIDPASLEVYKTLEVRESEMLFKKRRAMTPLKLIVDNTKRKKTEHG
ncbi:MAG: hypothetical protein V3V61_05275 [Gammaproteobacteria bacterium]